MGFKDLQVFNLSLLAKQGWRFVDDPEALVSKVFKAKYFPQCDFLNANLGHNPSYCWRSVWSSQAILREGVRWRVGDGSCINIWNQPWLRDDGRYLQTVPIDGLESLCVHDLREEGTQQWNLELLQHLLSPADCERVGKFP